MLMAGCRDHRKKDYFNPCFIELDLENLSDDLKHMLEGRTWGKEMAADHCGEDSAAYEPQGLGVCYRVIFSENL